MQYQTHQRVIQMALTLLEKQMKHKPVGFNSTVETMQYGQTVSFAERGWL